jgi:Arc/MetJ-type ribon-helix-helix transcriptional regulator
MISTRNRIITVRLSDDEYESLRAATQSRGYRNVSELARAAMHSVAGDILAPHQLLARRVDEHSTRIAELSRDVARLLSEVGSRKPGIDG